MSWRYFLAFVLALVAAWLALILVAFVDISLAFN